MEKIAATWKPFLLTILLVSSLEICNSNSFSEVPRWAMPWNKRDLWPCSSVISEEKGPVHTANLFLGCNCTAKCRKNFLCCCHRGDTDKGCDKEVVLGIWLQLNLLLRVCWRLWLSSDKIWSYFTIQTIHFEAWKSCPLMVFVNALSVFLASVRAERTGGLWVSSVQAPFRADEDPLSSGTKWHPQALCLQRLCDFVTEITP